MEPGDTGTSDYVYVNKYTSNVIRAVVAAPASDLASVRDPAPVGVTHKVPGATEQQAQVQREALDSYFAWLAWSNEHKEDSGALSAI